MDIKIMPSHLAGTVAAIPSKSQAHRLLICAALADRPADLQLDAVSEDIEATIRCLRSLGASIIPRLGGFHICPIAEPAAMAELDCGESGSTLRFLLPVVAALGKGATLLGHGRLGMRPLTALCMALAGHGCRVEGAALPLSIGGSLQSGLYTLPGDISSQYISGLLFALPLLVGNSEIRLLSPLESSGYVDMTIDCLARFGVLVQKTAAGYAIPGGQHYSAPATLSVEGDWSNAAFWLAANALGGRVQMNGLPKQSLQGDRAAWPLCQEFAMHIQSGDPLHISINGANIPDLVPILAVLAAATPGETRFYQVGRLRLKESDRIRAVESLLRALGARVESGADFLTVYGGLLHGGEVDGCRDHRIVMAAAIAASACAEPVVIRGAEAVRKSYPHFFADYERLGGNIHVL